MYIIFIWSGRGLIGLLVILLALSLPVFLIGILGGAFFPNRELLLLGIGFQLGLLAAGSLGWWLGRRWNAAMPWEHTIYYFPVEYWGAALLLTLAGIWILRVVELVT